MPRYEELREPRYKTAGPERQEAGYSLPHAENISSPPVNNRTTPVFLYLRNRNAGRRDVRLRAAI